MREAMWICQECRRVWVGYWTKGRRPGFASRLPVTGHHSRASRDAWLRLLTSDLSEYEAWLKLEMGYAEVGGVKCTGRVRPWRDPAARALRRLGHDWRALQEHAVVTRPGGD